MGLLERLYPGLLGEKNDEDGDSSVISIWRSGCGRKVKGVDYKYLNKVLGGLRE